MILPVILISHHTDLDGDVSALFMCLCCGDMLCNHICMYALITIEATNILEYRLCICSNGPAYKLF